MQTWNHPSATEGCLKYFITIDKFIEFLPEFPCIMLFIEFYRKCIAWRIIMKRIEIPISVQNLKRSHHVENAHIFNAIWYSVFHDGKRNGTKTTTTIIIVNRKNTLFVYTRFFLLRLRTKTPTNNVFFYVLRLFRHGDFVSILFDPFDHPQIGLEKYYVNKLRVNLCEENRIILYNQTIARNERINYFLFVCFALEIEGGREREIESGNILNK